ncbi:MAG: hypothetical protein ACRYGM_05845 [Janthinobacterium lividum]
MPLPPTWTRAPPRLPAAFSITLPVMLTRPACGRSIALAPLPELCRMRLASIVVVSARLRSSAPPTAACTQTLRSVSVPTSPTSRLAPTPSTVPFRASSVS